MLNGLTATLPFQNGFLLEVAFRRNNQSDGFTNRLFRRVTKHLLRSAIPGTNDSLKGLADDCVVRRLHNRRQLRERPLSIAHFSNVDVGAKPAANIPGFIEDGYGT